MAKRPIPPKPERVRPFARKPVDDINSGVFVAPDIRSKLVLSEEDPVDGIIAHCGQLNIREAPSKTAKILFMLMVGTRLLVEPQLDQDWYKITVLGDPSKVGYAMSEFIEER